MGEDGIPEAHPICSSAKGMGVYLNDLISDILEPLADHIQGGNEVLSGEQMLHTFESINMRWEVYSKSIDGAEKLTQLEDHMILGADVVSLYPNLLKNEAVEIVRKEVVQFEIKYVIDWQEAARYINVETDLYHI